MQHIIFQQTSLLYNRHLDQVLLSAIYGICKVAQLKQISFKQIINHYRRQPQAKSDVFRTVILVQSDVDLQVRDFSWAVSETAFLNSAGSSAAAVSVTTIWLIALMLAQCLKAAFARCSSPILHFSSLRLAGASAGSTE